MRSGYGIGARTRPVYGVGNPKTSSSRTMVSGDPFIVNLMVTNAGWSESRCGVSCARHLYRR
ncbi:hypothetical protein K435DRAFT_785171 [Dendrothele bispora CBS 962.96]|uniref:Uncharacterized protein n=1 Tax=Dendrothele bispora (strain CBS 962.96) TaxID=1314807 RepID=A0A4V4HBX5_DENBC|nr:hypothetical protein K435DRAFT_785171 [Dendrothele bispora CBS 962.96]